MPTLPLHPAVVHLPLGLAFVLPFLAAALAIAVRRQRLPRAALAIVVGLQVLVVAGGVVAMQLGEREADRVETVTGEAVIHAHEERAEAFVWTAAGVLAASIALLLVPPGLVSALSVAVVLGAAGVAVLGALTGHAGGQIVYAHGGAAAFRAPVAAPAAADRDED